MPDSRISPGNSPLDSRDLVAEAELRQAHAIACMLPPGGWYALLMAATTSLRDPALPDEAGQQLALAIKAIGEDVFKHLPGCKRLLNQMLHRQVNEHNADTDAFALRGEPWILTVGGTRFFPLKPNAADISITDIAHALANLCRFGGHSTSFYSVAQHSVLVARQVPPEHRLAALLHDASEAYLIDLPRPIKRHPWLRAYKAAEERLQALIFEKFGLSPLAPPCVAEADRLLLATEARDVMPALPADWKYSAEKGCPVLERRIEPFEPFQAELMFLDEYASINKAMRDASGGAVGCDVTPSALLTPKEE
jgi:uncharacterized protein